MKLSAKVQFIIVGSPVLIDVGIKVKHNNKYCVHYKLIY